MQQVIRPTLVAVFLILTAASSMAQNLTIGTKFSLERLSAEKRPTDATIIAFVPSLGYECEYASMLTQSFYYYFDKQLAFEGLGKAPSTQVYLVVADGQKAETNAKNIIGGMNVIYDEKGALFTAFGLTKPNDKNADSTVVLLDANGVVALIDAKYRAQGEHLKPLENKLKQLNGIYSPPEATGKRPLKIGDLAPDFRVNGKQMLADLRGEVVLVSFYPAAFSGTLPKPLELLLNGSTLKLMVDAQLMSCSNQISSLDLLPKFTKQPKRIVISSSTPSLLQHWHDVLGTRNIEYTNDPDYSISTSYLSYNPNGYNNRVSVIIDQKGKIAYIDTDFEDKDEEVLRAKMNELLTPKQR